MRVSVSWLMAELAKGIPIGEIMAKLQESAAWARTVTHHDQTTASVCEMVSKWTDEYAVTVGGACAALRRGDAIPAEIRDHLALLARTALVMMLVRHEDDSRRADDEA